MKISLSKNALDFLESISEKQKEMIRQKLKSLVTSIEKEGTIPFKELMIKNLKGEWRDCMRMRVGKIRVIFELDRKNDVIYVYEIDFRGNVYKKKRK